MYEMQGYLVCSMNDKAATLASSFIEQIKTSTLLTIMKLWVSLSFVVEKEDRSTMSCKPAEADDEEPAARGELSAEEGLEAEAEAGLEDAIGP
ncbi:hypothetical protein SADUNF_Sadunf18G0114400 [Salix dunnii]|uniref:Uncharacterized protein n=1 Tax=Salix dunnii TaxID=1413687 RepID=A0A835J4P6_9ROSI|nr:hypothetical protein SADUNF_Sadunf18G0114400 [Salix dunnii]